jgi:hypothetical protein
MQQFMVIRHYTTLYNVIQDYKNYDTIQDLPPPQAFKKNKIGGK